MQRLFSEVTRGPVQEVLLSAVRDESEELMDEIDAMEERARGFS